MAVKGQIEKRTLVRIISFALAAVIVVSVAFINLYTERNDYRRQVENSYGLALDELAESLDTINVTLQKGLYSTTALSLSSVSSALTKAAGTAKSALSTLPFSGGELDTINKFLSQVGDYTTSLSRGAISGNKISQQDHENLRLLADAANKLYSAISDIITGSAQPGDSMITGADDEINEFSTTMLETEEAITDYPTLVYDGPFSDHLVNAEPKLLKNQQEITKEGARQVAALYLGASTDKIYDDSDEGGNMASYCFTTENASIAITKRGGFCSYFRKNRTVGDETKDYDDAKRIASDYLKNLGLGEFEESYFITDEGLCVINFAYSKNGVIFYPDLVKVGVALDNGEILLFEGRGYIMNHTERAVQEPERTAEEARAILSDALTVDSQHMAVIPTDGGNEKFCYEFVCHSDTDEDVLVYINADTLEEESILILLKVDGGVLTK